MLPSRWGTEPLFSSVGNSELSNRNRKKDFSEGPILFPNRENVCAPERDYHHYVHGEKSGKRRVDGEAYLVH